MEYLIQFLKNRINVDTDANGNPVFRVVDAAPFAYDPVRDCKRILPFTMDTTLQSATSGNANGNVANTTHVSTLCVQITGTFTSGTVYFEASIDGANWAAITGVNIITAAVVSSATATGIYQFDVRGIKAFRARFASVVSDASGLTAISHATAS